MRSSSLQIQNAFESGGRDSDASCDYCPAQVQSTERAAPNGKASHLCLCEPHVAVYDYIFEHERRPTEVSNVGLAMDAAVRDGDPISVRTALTEKIE